ncbi:hypothetical protein GLAREA_09117 [Glarea lozoyensis ATCC 20868]|uniref:Deoxyribonuclease NucA/NucB domain-containing protein n=1 Tax=Glarea lozoyensis (strain ATCC 20868 / MF5171) TaxID=1116229 RepID=S3DIG8_GLAL2|nr:uncharacterized protein GLAREA_09117 [Glarea lozoyensis ATCC 20868]EPE36954.1 hypothetical protein GLAREA_09117 [Glarea lozoyensis ATCC 20868]
MRKLIQLAGILSFISSRVQGFVVPPLAPERQVAETPATNISTQTIEESITIVKRSPTIPSPAVGELVREVLLDCIKHDPGDGALEDICNVDCYAHLCLDRPTTMKYTPGKTNIDPNRILSGYGVRPFTGDDEKMAARGVARLGPEHQSGEEIPFASTAQGGSGQEGTTDEPVDFTTQALLAGVRAEGQPIQGRALAEAYREATPSPVQNMGDWFDIKYKSDSYYCLELAKWRSGQLTAQQREDICRKKEGKGKEDPVFRVFVKTTKKGQRNAKFAPAVRGEGVFDYFKPVSRRAQTAEKEEEKEE